MNLLAATWASFTVAFLTASSAAVNSCSWMSTNAANVDVPALGLAKAQQGVHKTKWMSITLPAVTTPSRQLLCLPLRHFHHFAREPISSWPSQPLQTAGYTFNGCRPIWSHYLKCHRTQPRASVSLSATSACALAANCHKSQVLNPQHSTVRCRASKPSDMSSYEFEAQALPASSLASVVSLPAASSIACAGAGWKANVMCAFEKSPSLFSLFLCGLHRELLHLLLSL